MCPLQSGKPWLKANPTLSSCVILASYFLSLRVHFLTHRCGSNPWGLPVGGEQTADMKCSDCKAVQHLSCCTFSIPSPNGASLCGCTSGTAMVTLQDPSFVVPFPRYARGLLKKRETDKPFYHIHKFFKYMDLLLGIWKKTPFSEFFLLFKS